MREHSHDHDTSWAREASAATGTGQPPAWIRRARRCDGDPLPVTHKYLLTLAWAAVTTQAPGHRTIDATAARLLQDDLAELCEVSVATIRRWERELRSAGLMSRPRPGLIVLADVLADGYLPTDEETSDKVCVACRAQLTEADRQPPPPAPRAEHEAQARPAPPPANYRIPSELWRVVTDHPATASFAVQGSTWASAFGQWVASASPTPALLKRVLDDFAGETAARRDRGTLTEAWDTGQLPKVGTLFFTSARYKGSAAWLRAAYDRATKALAPRTEQPIRPAMSARELARLELEPRGQAPRREPERLHGLERETSTPTPSATQHPRGRRPT